MFSKTKGFLVSPQGDGVVWCELIVGLNIAADYLLSNIGDTEISPEPPPAPATSTSPVLTGGGGGGD